MKNGHQIILQIICFLLILMWVYAASSKLMDFGLFRAQMNLQILPPYLKTLLVYLLPPFEILIAVLLLFEASLRLALKLSFLMLFAFTIYIGMAISNSFGKIPCSCGGVFQSHGGGVPICCSISYLCC